MFEEEIFEILEMQGVDLFEVDSVAVVYDNAVYVIWYDPESEIINVQGAEVDQVIKVFKKTGEGF